MMTSSWTTRTWTTTNKSDYWDIVFADIRDAIGAYRAGVQESVDTHREERLDPFHVLLSTVISLRTRDEVTIPATKRLLERAPTPCDLSLLPEEEVAELIYPAGFYRTKGRNLIRIAEILVERYAGEVPATVEELTGLPGVGRKTANLVLGLGFAVPAICVDIHVHRISNRLGWVTTASPEATEQSLMKCVPQRFWIPMNQWLVGFGQKICTPRSPRCTRCPLESACPKTGVLRHR